MKALKALIEADEIIKKDPNAAASLIAERIKVDPEIVRNFLPRTDFDLKSGKKELVAEFEAQAKWAIDNKLVRSDIKIPDFNAVVVTGLLDQARKK